MGNPTRPAIGRVLGLCAAAAILSVAALAVLALAQMQTIARESRRIYEHPFMVQPAAISAALHAERMIRGLEEAAASESDYQLFATIESSQREYEAFLIDLDKVQDHIYGEEGRGLERSLRERVKAWAPIRNRALAAAVRRDGRAELAALHGENEAFLATLRPAIQEIVDYAEARAEEFNASAMRAQDGAMAWLLFLSAAIVVLVAAGGLLSTRWIKALVGGISMGMARAEETGELAELPVTGDDDFSRMVQSFNSLLSRFRRDLEAKDAQAALLLELSAKSSSAELASALARIAAGRAGAEAGAVYAIDQASRELRLLGTWGRSGAREGLPLGEGPAGQAALDGKPRILARGETLPSGGQGGLLTAYEAELPRETALVPFHFGEETIGLAEYSSLRPFAPEELELLAAIHAAIAPYLRALGQNERIGHLLAEADKARSQAEKAEASEHAKAVALEDANAALEEQRQELEQQGEELRAMNEELRQSSVALRREQAETAERNLALELARAEIEKKVGELEAANNYKSDFLSRMSHELRTPLNSLLILANDLAENRSGHLDEEERAGAAIILGAGRDLLGLINEILDLARIESGKVRIERSELSPGELLSRLSATFAPLAREKSLVLEIGGDDGLPPSVLCDAARLEQILRNLLANAIKFTDRGSVRLRAAASGATLRFEVEDTGIGVPEDQREKIFLPFEQGDSSISRRYGGSGLGLAISRELARLMGGRLELARSEPGRGTVFELSLPLDLPAPERAGLEESERRNPAQKRILLAAAAAEDRASLSKILEAADLEVQPFARAAEALPALASGAFDLAVLGLRPGRGEDYYLLEDLKTLDPGSLPPVIAYVFGELDRQGEWRARELVDAIIIDGKASASRLAETAEGLLRRGREPRRAARRGASGLAGKTILLVDDDMRNLFALAKVLDAEGIRVVKADGGERALAALEAEPAVDAVLTDMMMPGMSGLELIARLRADPRFKDRPVIAVTAKAMKADRDACLAAGASDYLTKPVEVDRLLSLLKVWLY